MKSAPGTPGGVPGGTTATRADQPKRDKATRPQSSGLSHPVIESRAPVAVEPFFLKCDVCLREKAPTPQPARVALYLLDHKSSVHLVCMKHLETARGHLSFCAPYWRTGGESWKSFPSCPDADLKSTPDDWRRFLREVFRGEVWDAPSSPSPAPRTPAPSRPRRAPTERILMNSECGRDLEVVEVEIPLDDGTPVIVPLVQQRTSRSRGGDGSQEAPRPTVAAGEAPSPATPVEASSTPALVLKAAPPPYKPSPPPSLRPGRVFCPWYPVCRKTYTPETLEKHLDVVHWHMVNGERVRNLPPSKTSQSTISGAPDESDGSGTASRTGADAPPPGDPGRDATSAGAATSRDGEGKATPSAVPPSAPQVAPEIAPSSPSPAPPTPAPPPGADLVRAPVVVLIGKGRYSGGVETHEADYNATVSLKFLSSRISGAGAHWELRPRGGV